MDEASLQIMLRLLRPVTPDEIAACARARTAPQSGGEQLWLSDAELLDEVFTFGRAE